MLVNVPSLSSQIVKGPQLYLVQTRWTKYQEDNYKNNQNTIHTGIGFITDYQRRRDLASLHSKLHNSYIKNMRISYWVDIWVMESEVHLIGQMRLVYGV